MLQLIFADLDGTLAGHEKKEISLLVKEKMEILRKKGIEFGLATAHSRESKTMLKFAQFYRMKFLILENGSLIFFRSGFSYKRLKTWDKYNKGRKKDLEKFRKFLLTNFKRMKDSSSDLPFLPYAQVKGELKLNLYVSPEKTFMALLALDDKFSNLTKFLQNFCRRSKLKIKFIEATAKSVGVGLATKGEAITFLAHKEKIPLKKIAAIGDAENDREMLRAVGFPATVKNGEEKLKRIVRRKKGVIASAETTEGVGEILDKIIFLEKMI